VWYCDDWLLGFAGPKHEAEEIKSRIRHFLREELKLELSASKTLITHATSQAASFLGYQIRAQHVDTKITRGRRSVNGVMGLFVPTAVIHQRCARHTKRIARKLTPNGPGAARRHQDCEENPGQAPEAPGPRKFQVNLPAILLVIQRLLDADRKPCCLPIRVMEVWLFDTAHIKAVPGREFGVRDASPLLTVEKRSRLTSAP
jgi:hypothetical protein